MKNRHLLIFCATLALASCGGGSSFNGGSTDTSTGLGLTSTNALTAASVSYRAAFGSGELANVGGSIGAGFEPRSYMDFCIRTISSIM